MTNEQIQALWDKAKREGNKRIALLCDAALDTWYFSPSVRAFARRTLEKEVKAS